MSYVWDIQITNICDLDASGGDGLERPAVTIWKPIPVRMFYTFVIYQGYDMDILSGKSYDVIYHIMTWISQCK